MTQAKLTSLQTYANSLKQRLQGPVPPNHAHRPEAFKQMLEIDLKKTLSRIEKG